MLEVQQADYKRISTAPGSVGVRTPSGRFVNVVMRQDQKPFNDVRVRQAMALAIDRPTLVDIILESYGRPAATTASRPAIATCSRRRHQNTIPPPPKNSWPRPAIRRASRSA